MEHAFPQLVDTVAGRLSGFYSLSSAASDMSARPAQSPQSYVFMVPQIFRQAGRNDSLVSHQAFATW